MCCLIAAAKCADTEWPNLARRPEFDTYAMLCWIIVSEIIITLHRLWASSCVCVPVLVTVNVVVLCVLRWVWTRGCERGSTRTWRSPATWCTRRPSSRSTPWCTATPSLASSTPPFTETTWPPGGASASTPRAPAAPVPSRASRVRSVSGQQDYYYSYYYDYFNFTYYYGARSWVLGEKRQNLSVFLDSNKQKKTADTELNDVQDSWLFFLFIFFKKQFLSSCQHEPGRPFSLVGFRPFGKKKNAGQWLFCFFLLAPLGPLVDCGRGQPAAGGWGQTNERRERQTEENEGENKRKDKPAVPVL